jgi:UTP-glucose-1-phosphate uridylyltransferase
VLFDHSYRLNSDCRLPYQYSLSAPSKTTSDFTQLSNILAKQQLKVVQSNLAIVAHYMLSSATRSLLGFATPRIGGEIQFSYTVAEMNSI